MEETKIYLNTLVKRLFEIDAQLTKETSQLVSEYNQIVEEIYTTLEGLKRQNTPSKVLTKNKRGNNDGL